MPKVRTDWIETFMDMEQDTTGWSVESHIRTAAGATPATLKLSTADGTLLVGQAVDSGATNGIAINVAAADMDFAAGTYEMDVLRTDGGRNEDLLRGDVIVITFIEPITEVGLA